MNAQQNQTKIIGGVTFTEGEIVRVNGVGLLIVKFTKRGIVLRRPPQNNAMTKEEWLNGK